MLRRRTITLSVSAVLLAGFGAGAYLQPVPYVQETPGPTFDVLGSYQGTPLITVSGHQTYPTTGELRMVTVSVSNESWQMPIGTAIQGWFSSQQSILPKEIIYPPNTTQQQSDAQNAQEFSDSQNEAVSAALGALGIKPTGVRSEVASTDPGAPAEGKLLPGDQIGSVDGTKITGTADQQAAEIQKIIQALPIGAKVTFGITRNGAAQTVTTGTVSSGSANGSKPVAIVGIGLESENEFPFSVDIQLNGIGGPSAGMMFALGIIDKITDRNLAGGRTIAGTGTIDGNGVVGAIGGIQMKTQGARRDGATVFLAPAANCAEAKENVPAGLELVSVSTLQDALNALADLRAGKTPPLC
ncbi:MAG TPA: S16 family serine protease [Actinocrinis sp.]|nr:S16 family serine protease [Actinocrinis sp.]